MSDDMMHADGTPEGDGGLATEPGSERKPLGDVEVVLDPAATLVRLSGEVDLSLSDELSQAYRDCRSRAQPVRVDATELTFIDSTGIGFVARLAAAEQAAGRRLRIEGASRRTSETLSLTGLDELLELA